MAFYAVRGQSPRSPAFLIQFPLTPHSPTGDSSKTKLLHDDFVLDTFKFVSYKFKIGNYHMKQKWIFSPNFNLGQCK